MYVDPILNPFTASSSSRRAAVLAPARFIGSGRAPNCHHEDQMKFRYHTVAGCTSCPMAHDVFDSSPTCGHPLHGPASTILDGLVGEEDQDGVMVPDTVPEACPLRTAPIVLAIQETDVHKGGDQ